MQRVVGHSEHVGGGEGVFSVHWMYFEFDTPGSRHENERSLGFSGRAGRRKGSSWKFVARRINVSVTFIYFSAPPVVTNHTHNCV